MKLLKKTFCSKTKKPVKAKFKKFNSSNQMKKDFKIR